MLPPEPFDPPQQRRRLDPSPRARLHHRGLERPVPATVPLPKVEPRLEHPAAAAHSAAPIACPSATAASPAPSDTAMFAHSTRASPPSPARWDSSIQVENVV